MKNTKTPMKDKETKEWIREQIEGIEAYNYSATTNGIMEAIGKLEREAERRGRMNTCNKIKEYVESESGKSGRKEILKYIKLLEEEK